jgi:hypothetical protein
MPSSKKGPPSRNSDTGLTYPAGSSFHSEPLQGMKDALAQQGKASSTVHHAFDELDFVALDNKLSRQYTC